MDSGIMVASEKLQEVMEDEPTLDIYWRREMARRDMVGQLEYARDEGHAEGRIEGIEQNTIEIARKMKEMGETFNKIQIFTGLSPEAIEQL